MNCKKCKYMQHITKNKKARCLTHGISVLVSRFEKTIEKEKSTEMIIRIKGKIFIKKLK